MPTPSKKLTERQYKTLELTASFGVMTVQSVHKQILPGHSYDAAKSLVHRLCGKGPRYRFLRPESLNGKRVYYRLTRRATEILGVSVRLARCYGPLASIDRYARLWFMCVENSAKRKLLNPREFGDRFANVRQPGIQLFVGQTPNEEPTLGYAMVDHGRSVHNLQKRAASFFRRHLTAGWLHEFLDANSFELSILTVTEEKKLLLQREVPKALNRNLQHELKRYRHPENTTLPFTLSVWVVPHLIDALPEIR